MVTINHGVISLPSKPLNSTNKTESAKQTASASEAVSPVYSSLSSVAQSPELANQEYRQLQYDRPDGKHQKALTAYMDVMLHSRKEQLSNLIGIDMVV
ncbi:hypothetical protein [Photobacterium leiognathi]|uniref:hypothetical protein n=1 Tax=Photobacterium leiognathi TaxID=553611 RepID=UPI002980E9DF|nr:hypothetical protein [Photobacterium leiognathi]